MVPVPMVYMYHVPCTMYHVPCTTVYHDVVVPRDVVVAEHVMYRTRDVVVVVLLVVVVMDIIPSYHGAYHVPWYTLYPLYPP